MNRFLLIISLLLFTGCGGHRSPAWDIAAVRPKHPWGYYSGQVEARWENDGRHMTLLSELHYTDPDGVVWVAPAGSGDHTASIPPRHGIVSPSPLVTHGTSCERHTLGTTARIHTVVRP